MRFSNTLRTVAIATGTVTLSLFFGLTAQAETLRLAQNTAPGSETMNDSESTDGTSNETDNSTDQTGETTDQTGETTNQTGDTYEGTTPAPSGTEGTTTPSGQTGTDGTTTTPSGQTGIDGTTTPSGQTGIDGTTTQPGQTSASGTIVDVATNSGSFNTLVQAVQAAGLTDTLAGSGPYTVFAPSDQAFNQLPEGAVEFLLLPENRDLLVEVLSYHVVPGEITSDQLTTGGVDTLNGGLAVNTSGQNVVVNNASVVTPDVQASNGVIHVINRVLIPEDLRNQLASRLGVQSLYQ